MEVDGRELVENPGTARKTQHSNKLLESPFLCSFGPCDAFSSLSFRGVEEKGEVMCSEKEVAREMTLGRKAA